MCVHQQRISFVIQQLSVIAASRLIQVHVRQIKSLSFALQVKIHWARVTAPRWLDHFETKMETKSMVFIEDVWIVQVN